jgi:hypothetical protein
MDIESDIIDDDSWDGINQSSGTDGGSGDSDLSVFMKLEKRAEPYRVRLVCKPVNFRKHWDAFRSLKEYPISPAYKPEEKDLDVSWSKGNYCPRKKHAVLVFDRDNNSKIRVLEGGAQIFNAFHDFAQLTKKNPAGPSGPDWLISVGTNSRNQVEYTVMASPEGAKPFTDEEIASLSNSNVNREWLTDKIYVRSTPEEIAALWEQLPEDRKYSTKEAGSKAKSKPEEPVASQASAPIPPESDSIAGDDFLKDGAGQEPPEEASAAPAAAPTAEAPAAPAAEAAAPAPTAEAAAPAAADGEVPAKLF